MADYIAVRRAVADGGRRSVVVMLRKEERWGDGRGGGGRGRGGSAGAGREEGRL
jgi:hypothetical protein